MKEMEKRRGPNNKQVKRSSRSETRDHKLQERNGGKNLKAKETDVKASSNKPESTTAARNSNAGSEPSEVYEHVLVHDLDETNKSEDASDFLKTLKTVEKENTDRLTDHSIDLESETKEGIAAEVSDTEITNDSISSQESPQAADEKVEKGSSALSKPEKIDSSYSRKTNNIQKAAKRRTERPYNGSSKTATKTMSHNIRNMKVHPKPSSESSEGADVKLLDEKEADFLEGVSNDAQSVCSNDETINTEENGEPEDKAVLQFKIEEMERKIEKLEEELREVAALEIALYSVVPEHGSSAHKVHTPARRLSRLYLHACKYWLPDKWATVSRNIVSGLILVAKSCGNDVSRLTFWLSNTVVLREIISQAFGSTCHASVHANIFETSGGKQSELKSSLLKWKGNAGSRQQNKLSIIRFVDDWQETRTFTAALERVESWIFSRIVESIWWQTLTPNMQSPDDVSTKSKDIGRLLGPTLGDQQQGNLSINLWKNAFHDALKRLCPVRAGGHDCGCLPVLAMKVLEQCVHRLDVAMFNAILRESIHQIPTDPVSDPIVDPKVLPIPAGDLSFGSGAQLKNSVGNWARYLTDLLGTDIKGPEDKTKDTEDEDPRIDNEPKCFPLLNELSDLLMLPKDMLMDRAIRMEVCPSISISLVKRILCNFTPDEFCPDAVPGAVLEALNAECIIERRLSSEPAIAFPYIAAPVVYKPPSSSDVSEKVAADGGKSRLERSTSSIQRKGYTSDEELNELETCLTSINDKTTSSPPSLANGNGNHRDDTGFVGDNARYELLRAVWRATT